MRVWGAIIDPGRDFELYGPAISTYRVAETVSPVINFPKVCENRSTPHDPQHALHQLLVPRAASNASVERHSGARS